jgi:hypothetical protein
MARKQVPPWIRIVIALSSWAVAVAFAEGEFGPDIGRAVHRVEERIEMQLKGGSSDVPAQAPVQPERSHEDAIEPWELVSV